jgi:hypothetical protein
VSKTETPGLQPGGTRPDSTRTLPAVVSRAIPEVKIIQILRADGWRAVFRGEKGIAAFDVPCWALCERRYDDGELETAVVAMGVDGGSFELNDEAAYGSQVTEASRFGFVGFLGPNDDVAECYPDETVAEDSRKQAIPN